MASARPAGEPAPMQTTAGRLHALLLRLQRNASGSVLDAWRNALNERRPENAFVFERLADVIRLVQDTRRDIETALPTRSVQFYLQVFPNIEALVGETNLGQGWPNLLPRLQEPVLSRLEAAHLALETAAATAAALSGGATAAARLAAREIPVDALARFRARVAALAEEVVSAPAAPPADLADGLPPELKRVLLDLLDGLRRALTDYAIDGADGIERSVVYAVGLLARHQQAFAAAALNPTVQRAARTTSRLARLVDWTRRHASDIQTGAALAQVVLGVLQLHGGAAAVAPVLLLPPGLVGPGLVGPGGPANGGPPNFPV